MSGKRPSLADSMRQAAAVEPPATAPLSIPSGSVPARQSAPAARPAGFYAATRAGKKKVTTTLDPAAHKQLKNLATDNDMTTEALINEAINDLFRKHGKQPIA